MPWSCARPPTTVRSSRSRSAAVAESVDCWSLTPSPGLSGSAFPSRCASAPARDKSAPKDRHWSASSPFPKALRPEIHGISAPYSIVNGLRVSSDRSARCARRPRARCGDRLRSRSYRRPSSVLPVPPEALRASSIRATSRSSRCGRPDRGSWRSVPPTGDPSDRSTAAPHGWLAPRRPHQRHPPRW